MSSLDAADVSLGKLCALSGEKNADICFKECSYTINPESVAQTCNDPGCMRARAADVRGTSFFKA